MLEIEGDRPLLRTSEGPGTVDFQDLITRRLDRI